MTIEKPCRVVNRFWLRLLTGSAMALRCTIRAFSQGWVTLLRSKADGHDRFKRAPSRRALRAAAEPSEGQLLNLDDFSFLLFLLLPSRNVAGRWRRGRGILGRSLDPIEERASR